MKPEFPSEREQVNPEKSSRLFKIEVVKEEEGSSWNIAKTYGLNVNPNELRGEKIVLIYGTSDPSINIAEWFLTKTLAEILETDCEFFVMPVGHYMGLIEVPEELAKKQESKGPIKSFIDILNETEFNGQPIINADLFEIAKEIKKLRGENCLLYHLGKLNVSTKDVLAEHPTIHNLP
ncbi:MAG: hypothetical protein C4278_01665, partial [Patescibacteria group bacterium]